MILQVPAKTGVHLLNDEHRQARALLQVHAQELDYVGVTQFGPRAAFGLKVAEEFLRSSCRIVFEEDFVQALCSARSAVPYNLVNSRVEELLDSGSVKEERGQVRCGGEEKGR